MARWILGLAITLLSSSIGQCAETTVWSGVYTDQQAARGAATYLAECSRCHREDLSGYSGLRGAKFTENWREDSLNSLWLRISKTMPAGAAGSLPENEYLDIMAYLLKANDFPAGAQELRLDDLPRIRFEKKSGPAPVPDFSLVQTVGCLAKDAEGIWRVKRAGDPVRTRNPYASSAQELEAAASQRLGTHTFRLLDGSSVKSDSHDGQRVKLKGFLIRKTNDDRINATSVEVVGADCPAI
ncbi:MAG: cytochrome c [Bryobacteraceae bacterium]